MFEKRYRTLEEQKGIGKIYIDDRLYDVVRYDIKIAQEFLVERNKKMPSVRSAIGTISPIGGKLYLEQGQLIALHLEDGRIWKCYAKSGNTALGWYQLVSADPVGVYKPNPAEE